MCEILIFGGTTEGRLLAEFCHEHRLRALVSVTSEYGRRLLPDSPWLEISAAPLEEAGMEALIRETGSRLVLDATHPYAAEATRHIEEACRAAGVPCVRVARESSPLPGRVIWADTAETAAEYLKTAEGSVFLATGSRELSAFAGLPGFADRVYARVLPTAGVIQECERMGIRGKHLIGMQGPFSREINAAMFRATGVSYLVTKEAGAAGGFEEKLEAAADCDVTVLVIGRPAEKAGVSLEEARKILAAYGSPSSSRLRVAVIGAGMGGDGQMTEAAVSALRGCDALLGSPRVLETAAKYAPGAERGEVYLGREVVSWIREHKERRNIGVVYSGDPGFYSGARELMEWLRAEEAAGRCETAVYPGISTVSYLCGRLMTGWEEARLLSLHGREADIVRELVAHPKLFVLLGGEGSVNSLCGKLEEAGYGEAFVAVGERLSYPEEKITVGTPGQLRELDFGSLSAVLILREGRELERGERP